MGVTKVTKKSDRIKKIEEKKEINISKMVDYYSVLEVTKGSTTPEIKKA